MQLGLNQSESLSQMANQKITVQLVDLDWDDRERILRLLFSKMNTGASANDWRDNVGTGSQKEGSSHMATGLNQSFREQEEEDYDDEGDAQIFEKTTLPPENYTRGGTDSDPNNKYYDEG